MKVAILLCGHIRAWHLCKDSFLNFYKDCDYDVYINTYHQLVQYHPYIKGVIRISEEKNNARMELTPDMMANYLGIDKDRIKGIIIEDESKGLEEVKLYYNNVDPTINYYQWGEYDEFGDLQVIKGKGISFRTYYQFRKFRDCFRLIGSSSTCSSSTNPTGSSTDIPIDIDKNDCSSDPNIPANRYDYIIKVRFDIDYSMLLYTGITIKNMMDEIGRNDMDNLIYITPSGYQPSDHIIIGTPRNIEQLVKCMENPQLNYDREYNPHEYLSHSVISSNCKLCHVQCLSTMSIKRI